MSEQTERIEGEVPIPGTEALAQHEMVQMFGGDVKPKTEAAPSVLSGYRQPPHPDGKQECDTCGRITWPAIHSCPGFPRTDAAKERYAVRKGYPSWAALLATGKPDDNPSAPRPVHPRELDKWVRETQVPGLTVAVDAAGCIVLHTPLGSMTVTSVEGLVNDLRVAVQMRDAMEVFDGE